MLIPPPVPVTHPSLKRYSTSFIHIFGDTDLVKVATQLGDEVCRLLQFLLKTEFKRKRISYMERVVREYERVRIFLRSHLSGRRIDSDEMDTIDSEKPGRYIPRLFRARFGVPDLHDSVPSSSSFAQSLRPAETLLSENWLSSSHPAWIVPPVSPMTRFKLQVTFRGSFLLVLCFRNTRIGCQRMPAMCSFWVKTNRVTNGP
jgi:hypothetical protein